MQRSSRPGIAAFLLWALVGALGAGALATALTIGIFVLPVCVVGIVTLLLWPRTRNGSAVGAVAGIGVLPLYIALLNRDGPGNVCSPSGTGSACTEQWSPWPWAAAGLLLLTIGVVLFVSLRHVAAAPQARTPGSVITLNNQ